MHHQADDGKQRQQRRRGAGDGLGGPLALGLDAQMATDLGEGDLNIFANTPAFTQR
jgi:hypothetical protein